MSFEPEESSGNSTPAEPEETDLVQKATSLTTTTPRLRMVAERLRELKEKRESARKENLAEVIRYVLSLLKIYLFKEMPLTID